MTYTITVHNNGPGGSGYSVTDELPDGLANVHTDTAGCDVTGRTLSCTGGALDAGHDAVITVTGVANGAAQQLANTATVRGNDRDPHPGNDTSNQVVTVVRLLLSAVGTGLPGLCWVAAGVGLAVLLAGALPPKSATFGWRVCDSP